MTSREPHGRRGIFDTGIRFATSNPLKLQEALALVPDLIAFECDLPEIQAIDVLEVVSHKIQTLADMNLPFPLFVEDTGLEVPSSGSLPGALVKWFIESVGARGLARMMLGEMEFISAVAVSAVAAYNGSETSVAVGRVEGLLVPPRGNDFGWNSIFQPLGHNLTFAEMTDAERLAISMRRKPILESVEWIKTTSLPELAQTSVLRLKFVLNTLPMSPGSRRRSWSR